MREGSDSRAGHFTVRAVVKTDHGDISGNGHAGSVQIRDNHGGNLIVVADDGAAAGEKLRSARVFITAAQEAFLLVGAVPENVFVLNGEIKALQRIHIAGKTLPALQVVVFEDTGNLSVALSVQILRQHASPGIVVIQYGQRVRKLFIIAVHEHERDALFHKLMIERNVRVGQTGFRPFQKNAVQMVHIEQRFENPPFVGELILGREQKGSAVVFGTDRFNLAENTGENIVADIGCDNRDRKPLAGRGFLAFADMRTASLPAIDQVFRFQQRERLPHGLPADLKLCTEGLLGRKRFLISAILNTGSQRLCNCLIFWIHKQTPDIISFPER